MQIFRFLKNHFRTFFFKTLCLKGWGKTSTGMENFYIFLYLHQSQSLMKNKLKNSIGHIPPTTAPPSEDTDTSGFTRH